MARHSSLAEQLEAIRAFVQQPDHAPEPLQSNWATVAANDNDPEEVADLKHDRKRLVTPSVAEIMRNVKEGEAVRSETTTEMTTYNGVEHKTHTVRGPITRIGRLRFSDGAQTERAFRYTIDGKLEEYAARMPAGAMLGCRDKVDVALGGDENPQEVVDSNEYFSEMLNTKKPRYVSGRRHKGERVNLTHEEAKAELAAAYAGADMSKVTFTRYPDGLPCGSAKVADSFLGMQKTTSAGGGSVMWQDIVSQREERKEWLDAVSGMADKHFDILTLATKSSSLKQIGMARGFKGQYAIEAGKRLLVAANDNLENALEMARSAKNSVAT
ncbi:hypothetical protein A4U53_030900 [Rhizobium ruizarguesonis]|uniref:Uncharacterized protein n=2 Tax=Rhizobium TaxID=379 RepID=A0A179BUR3_RHILE|nr:hypothetical protein [Rhizobium leguminosarum]OAP95115.1 hypothetical protein A4U53_18000 [Rhizobium leguminosarum]